MKKTHTKSYKDWQAEEVEKAFGLKRLRTLPFLENVKSIKFDANHIYKAIIGKYRHQASRLIDGWGDDEYKFLFISPYLALINFSNENYTVFTQRYMSVLYENDTKKTGGKVEWMVARGRQIYKKPYVFFAPIIPENGTYLSKDKQFADPLGQLLIAMVGAQIVNKDDHPIYGIYVNGRNWFLVSLEGKQYATSAAYDITTNAIFDLFAILEHLRDKMDDLYMNLI